MRKPRILVTNDDGVRAEGLLTLARELGRHGEVLVCAPVSERSGTGHSITIRAPIQVTSIAIAPDIRAWAIDGSPADCVKYAVSNLSENGPPDLVVSGINSGLNLSTHIFYSGTLGAALEGAILGIPSIAVSLGRFAEPDDAVLADGAMEYAARLAADLAGTILERGMPARTCLNVNVPNLPPAELKGTRLTRHGRFLFDTRYERDEKTGGWLLRGRMCDIGDDPDPDLDYRAVIDGCVSITPLNLDLNDPALFELMRDWNQAGLLEG